MDNQREVAAMAENHGLSIETIVAEACALMRLRLKAQGIEVTHASHQHSHDLVGNEAGEPSFLYRTGSSRGPFVDTGVGLSIPRPGPVALAVSQPRSARNLRSASQSLILRVFIGASQANYVESLCHA